MLFRKKKYKLLRNDTIKIGDTTLHRIKALRNFGNVKKGELGGYIEKEYNLSHEDNCWVANSAKVLGSAEVYENAKIFGDAQVSDSRIFGQAKVYGNARVVGSNILDRAIVSDEANVYRSNIYDKGYVSANCTIKGSYVFNNARIIDECNIRNSKIYDRAKIYRGADIDNSCISGDVSVKKSTIRGLVLQNTAYILDADIRDENDICSISKFGELCKDITFYRHKNGSIVVNSSCPTYCSLDTFRSDATDCRNEEYAREYLAASILAEWRLTGKQKEE